MTGAKIGKRQIRKMIGIYAGCITPIKLGGKNASGTNGRKFCSKWFDQDGYGNADVYCRFPCFKIS
jgi:hypothetical protein